MIDICQSLVTVAEEKFKISMNILYTKIYNYIGTTTTC